MEIYETQKEKGADLGLASLWDTPVLAKGSAPTDRILAQWLEDGKSASKVTDPDTGEPMVVYHGTAQGGFDIFSRNAWLTAYGHFFTPKEENAKGYSHGGEGNPQVYAVYLDAKNPLRIDQYIEDGYGQPEWMQEWARDEFDPEYGDPVEQMQQWLLSGDLYSDGNGSRQDSLMGAAEENGHDAVVFYDAALGGGIAKSYVAFESTQIKSATGNSGAFDGSNPDIRYSRQPASVRQAQAFEQDAPISRQNLRRVKDAAMRQIDQVMSHPGKVSLWDKTVGTMRHLGEREPAFKPVFDAAQRFIDDVAMVASEVADAAPRLLPKLESWL